MNDDVSDARSQLVASIERLLNLYEIGATSLPVLTSELKPYVVAFRDIDDKWGSDLKDCWNQLEYINAVFIESGCVQLGKDERDEIRIVLQCMSDMLAKY